jgi:hypothetical protein
MCWLADEMVTAEVFEREYAERSGVTVDWLRSMERIVVPCACGDELCQGWAMVNRNEPWTWPKIVGGYEAEQ